MANWVHCNKCFEQLQKNKNISFFLTECGHLVCEKCSEKIKSSNACIICRKPTRVMKLCKDMDPSVRSFFNPLDIQFKKCIEIYNFQNNHKESFLANYVQKYEYAKQQCMKQCSVNNKLMQEKKTLRSIIQNSCDRNGPISSTPIDRNISFQNTSVSTITPERSFKFGAVGSRGHPSLFTPMKAVPGFAHRLSTSKLSSQSNVSQGISPAQVVPMFGRFNKPSVPIHRPPLGPMSSLHDLQMANRFKL